MGTSVITRSGCVVQALLLEGLCLCLLGLFSTSIHDLDVIVEYRSNDGHHVGLDDSGTDVFRSSDPNIHHALKCQIPFPHIHHILTPPGLEQTYQPLNTAIYRQNVPYPSRGGCEVSQVVQGVDEGEGRGAIERSAVIKGGGDAHGCLVDIGDAEVDFSHVEVVPQFAVWEAVGFVFLKCFRPTAGRRCVGIWQRARYCCCCCCSSFDGWHKIRDAMSEAAVAMQMEMMMGDVRMGCRMRFADVASLED